MKRKFRRDVVDDHPLVLCASEEERCTGIASRLDGGMPSAVVVFDYCGSSDRGALDFITSSMAKAGVGTIEVVKCAERHAVDRLRDQIHAMQSVSRDQRKLVVDFTVMPRPDLWMVLRWLKDSDFWERTSFVYTEPEDYSSVKSLPLSCGLKRIQTLVGEVGIADCSRPVHLIMQLGYEGDQALAVYEEAQPAKVTLLIPHPPFRSGWEGRTEEFNAHLIGLVGESSCRRVDAVDPEETTNTVKEIITNCRFTESTVVCPLGTKPQLLGLFAATVTLPEEPALLIPEPLRAASTARARGVGRSWTIG